MTGCFVSLTSYGHYHHLHASSGIVIVHFYTMISHRIIHINFSLQKLSDLYDKKRKTEFNLIIIFTYIQDLLLQILTKQERVGKNFQACHFFLTWRSGGLFSCSRYWSRNYRFVWTNVCMKSIKNSKSSARELPTRFCSWQFCSICAFENCTLVQINKEARITVTTSTK